MRTLIAVMAVGLLAACSGPPKVQSSTVDVVTVRYFGDEDRAAADTASQECSRYNRRARFRNVNSESSGERVAIYDCIP